MIALSSGRRSIPKTSLYLVAAGLIVALIGVVSDRASVPAPQAVSERPFKLAYGPADFDAALARANDQVALGEERVARAPEQWAYQESHARALMGRARLTGSFDDLAAARVALSRGLADAPAGAGPLLTDAVHLMSIHRLAPIARDLDLLAASAVPAGRDDRAEAAALRGDLAFYSGDYDDALRLYGSAARLDDGPGIAVRLGNWHKKTGQFDAALAQFDRALRSASAPTPQFHATMLLHKGVAELERGHWDAAAAFFRQADTAFPGHWLIEAHVAQMAAVKGDLAGAERGYLHILSRSGPNMPLPEVMDALAALYRAKGDAPQSRLWAQRAGAIWAERLRQLPEAAYGHALEHELVLGQPARALDLARRNSEARPYGDSAVMLAWALLANGRPDAAVQAIAALNRSAWRTAQQYVVLAEALAMLGRSEESDAAREAAMALNPRAFDPAASLIWFGNH